MVSTSCATMAGVQSALVVDIVSMKLDGLVLPSWLRVVVWVRAVSSLGCDSTCYVEKVKGLN